MHNHSNKKLKETNSEQVIKEDFVESSPSTVAYLKNQAPTEFEVYDNKVDNNKRRLGLHNRKFTTLAQPSE